jgi:hypothetical protein
MSNELRFSHTVSTLKQKEDLRLYVLDSRLLPSVDNARK